MIVFDDEINPDSLQGTLSARVSARYCALLQFRYLVFDGLCVEEKLSMEIRDGLVIKM